MELTLKNCFLFKTGKCGHHTGRRGAVDVTVLPVSGLDKIEEVNLIQSRTNHLFKFDEAICARHRHMFTDSYRPPKKCQHPLHLQGTEPPIKKAKKVTQLYQATPEQAASLSDYYGVFFPVGGSLCTTHRKELPHLPKVLLIEQCPPRHDLLETLEPLEITVLPIRRTPRVFTSEEIKRLQKEKIKKELLKNSDDDCGAKKSFISNEIGYGVMATEDFSKGDFIVEYAGDLITRKEALSREAKYDQDPHRYGSYVLYFKAKERRWAIDPTLTKDR